MNPRLDLPAPPTEFVSLTECVCGSRYELEQFGVRYRDGKAIMEPGRGFFGRKSVLWAMRWLKVSQWFEAHKDCCPNPLTTPTERRTVGA